MKLTEHFSEAELGVEDGTEKEKANALFLCNEILEPIREYYNTPIKITNGKRSPTHNDSVGGVPRSQHLFKDGNAAADFFIPKQMIQDVFRWIRLTSKLPFDQCILESRGGIPTVIHVSVNRERMPRRVALTGSIAGHLSGDKYERVEVV